MKIRLDLQNLGYGKIHILLHLGSGERAKEAAHHRRVRQLQASIMAMSNRMCFMTPAVNTSIAKTE